MYDSLKRKHHILLLAMISFTHITYSFWVPSDGLPGFDDRLFFVIELYPLIWDLSLAWFIIVFFFFAQAFNENGYLRPILIDL